MRRNRTKIANPADNNRLHVTQRCVRQDFFLDDGLPLDGKFAKRRDAVLSKLKKLASAFAIDVERFCFMSSHMHLEVRTRPELVALMDDEEVARRWFIICPGFCEALADFRNVTPDRPTLEDIKALAKDKERIAELRTRLSSISYFMWSLNLYTAKLFNLMDGKKGHFWEDRYKVKVLLDDLSTLLCAFYIDLNPIRADMSETPETSEYTSAYYQIESAEMQKELPDMDPAQLPDSFLAPIQFSLKQTELTLSKFPTRASDLGFLSVSSLEYLIALDIVGRFLRDGKRGAIPANIPPIFERLNLSWENAIELIDAYASLFKCFVGSKESLARKADELGGHKLRCPAERKKLLEVKNKVAESAKA